MKEGLEILKAFGKKAFAFFGKGQLISGIMMLTMFSIFIIGKYALAFADNFHIRFDQIQKENTEIKSNIKTINGDITEIKESQLLQTISQQDIVEELGSVGDKVDKNREAVVRQIEKSNLSTKEKINEIKNLYSTDNEKKNYVGSSNLTQLK